jgi:diguanylate cyclase (GGDEF)-like protein
MEHGLPPIERERFLLSLGSWVDSARQDDSNLGLLLIDLANLARINHDHGYATGDTLLATAYRELQSVSKLPRTVYRMGSHHFAFLLPQLDKPAFIALAINKVHRLLEEQLYLEQDMIGVDVRVGVAVNLGGRRSALSLLTDAEESLVRVKRGGSHEIDKLLRDTDEKPVDEHLEQLFVETLNDNAFELYFQPKLNLTTGKIDSAEALLRWHPPGRAPLSPDLAVEMASETGRNFELAKWVAHKALRQLKAWESEMPIGLAINIQADLVHSPDLAPMLLDALAVWHVEPSRLTIEITESGIIEDKESGFDNLLRLKEAGIKLSIDDFGTGYSSLSYFKHIPATQLKIDRSFISGMKTQQEDLQLVKIMIQIGHQFGLEVVAEGIEERDSLELLRELGCDVAQGYFISQPLAPGDFENWLTSWQVSDLLG